MKFFTADGMSPNIDGGIAGMGFTADKFGALLHRHDALDLRPRHPCSQGLVGALVTNGPDDGAFDPAHDMGFVSQLPYFPKHRGFVFGRNPGFENDDHNSRAIKTGESAGGLRS